MTAKLRADASGLLAAIQVNGIDRLLINDDGSLEVSSSPATGVRSLALATMQKFADEFVSVRASSGYQRLPSGLIIQWGVNTSQLAANTQQNVLFPIAFPTACLTAFAGAATSTTSASVALNAASYTANQITLHNSALQPANGRWFAIGH